MWCVLEKPVTCRKRWNCKIKEIHIIILMFFFIFYIILTSVTFDTSIRGDQFWKENNSNFHMISITRNINFAQCDGFSQITSQMTLLGNHMLQLVNPFTIYIFIFVRELEWTLFISPCINMSPFHSTWLSTLNLHLIHPYSFFLLQLY